MDYAVLRIFRYFSIRELRRLMTQFDQNDYQGRDPKRMGADVDALIALLRVVFPLLLTALLISLLADLFG